MVSLTYFCTTQAWRNSKNTSGGDTVVNKIDINVCAQRADILGDNRHRGDTDNTQNEYVYSMFSSVQFSCSVVSDSLRPHGLQHARPPCPSPTPGVYSDSCPLSQ